MTQLTQGIPQFGTGMETNWSNKQDLGGMEVMPSAYTLSMEFTQDGMVSEFSTDNNNLKAVVFFKRL